MNYLKEGAVNLGIRLNPRQLEQFDIYYRELLDWSRRINLTSITDFKEVQLKHFLDSLTVSLAIEQPDASRRFIDVGSGAGLPGLPLKIAFPFIKLILLEATGKKAAFLRHLVQKLELNDIEVLVGRAETVARETLYRQHFDIVLCRAVAPLSVVAELTLPLCAIGGSTIIQKKGDIYTEVKQAAGAIEILGGSQPELRSIELTEFIDRRYLVIIKKESPTPEKYPRRPGIPAKRPIL